MPAPRTSGTLWSIILRVARERPTFERTWNAIREAGLPLTRERFLQAWRGAWEFRRSAEAMARATPSHVPTADEIAQSPLRYSRPYVYRVEITGRDLAGQPFRQVVTTTFDQPVPLEAAIEGALDPDFLEESLPGIEVAGATVLAVERSA